MYQSNNAQKLQQHGDSSQPRKMTQPLGSSFTLLPCVSKDDATHSVTPRRVAASSGVPPSQSASAIATAVTTASKKGTQTSSRLSSRLSTGTSPTHESASTEPLNDQRQSAEDDCPHRAKQQLHQRATVSPFEPTSASTNTGTSSSTNANTIAAVASARTRKCISHSYSGSASKIIPTRRASSRQAKRFSTQRYYFGLPKAFQPAGGRVTARTHVNRSQRWSTHSPTAHQPRQHSYQPQHDYHHQHQQYAAAHHHEYQQQHSHMQSQSQTQSQTQFHHYPQSTEKQAHGAFRPPRCPALGRLHSEPVMRSVTRDFAETWYAAQRASAYAYSHAQAQTQAQAEHGYAHARASHHANYHHHQMTVPHMLTPTPTTHVSHNALSSASRDLLQDFSREAGAARPPYSYHYAHSYAHPAYFTPCVVSASTPLKQLDPPHELMDLPPTIFIANGYTSVPKDEDLSDEDDDDEDEIDNDEEQ